MLLFEVVDEYFLIKVIHVFDRHGKWSGIFILVEDRVWCELWNQGVLDGADIPTVKPGEYIPRVGVAKFMENLLRFS